ncbi:MAG: Ppx/GppA family phosphatase [Acidobacteriaceae bacterium]|nr:Ppx/GppA family phosphatase [Acidobacteriaceae bacterium]
MPRYAAIDVGSNSLRMLAADVSHGITTVLAQDRQVTRLGESVFRTGRISDDAMDFLVATLSRMASVYSRLNILGVRAVATSAVRDASNQQEFLQRAGEALGTHVEIISGAEEARLIHLGVEARWPRPGERTLSIDVGGGSAELIISQNGELIDSVSKPLGAVRLTEIFLKNDPPGPEDLRHMNSFITEKLHSFYEAHAGEKFDRAIGTSASAAAVVCAVNQIPRAERDAADRLGASLNQIQKLNTALGTSTLAQRRKLTGIGPRRAEIVVGGAAVFARSLEMFGHSGMYYCSAGVRDGVIADLAARGVGREVSRLSPEQRATAEALAKRYCVDFQHARHIAYLAGCLFDVLQSVHRLPPSAGKPLEAAGLLHDIGHFVSATGHHKHSAYLVANSDLPGFTDGERQVIAALCRFHRKSLPQPKHSYFDELNAESKRLVTYLTPLLRMADSLDRSNEGKVQNVKSVLRDNGIGLEIEANGDVGLELWAAGEAAKVFREIYGFPISVQRARAQSV